MMTRAKGATKKAGSIGFAPVVFLILSLLGGCSWLNAPLEPGTLYYRLGGSEGTQTIVDRFMVEILIEEKLNTAFINLASDKSKLSSFKQQIFNFICSLAEGGCVPPTDASQLEILKVRLTPDQVPIYLEKFSSILYDSALTGLDREFISTRTTAWLSDQIVVTN